MTQEDLDKAGYKVTIARSRLKRIKFMIDVIFDEDNK